MSLVKESKKISIITVVYNDKLGLQETIDNIRKQTYSNTEYIVIDGGSNDGTLEVIEENKDIIDFWLSEPDKGLFDAMNKGIKYSTGTWVNFMNAGDTFVTSDTLENCFFQKHENVALLYGDVLIGKNKKLQKPNPTSFIKGGSMIACHQSMFFNKDLLGVDLSYDLMFNRRCDHELLMRIYKKRYSLKYIDIPVSWFKEHGVSSEKSWQARGAKIYYTIKYFGFKGFKEGILQNIRK